MIAASEPSGRFYAHLLKPELNELLKSATFAEVLSDKLHQTDASNEELLHLGIGSLVAFLQYNFLGPREKQNLHESVQQTSNSRAKLKSDGEELNVNVVRADCLLVCKRIFEHLLHHDTEGNNSIPTGYCVRLWYQRYLLIHQRCIDDLTHDLYERFNANVAVLETALSTAEQAIKIEIYTEIMFGFIQFKRITKLEQWLQKLETLSNVKLTVEGALGLRTKFQQTPLPQLTLRLQGVSELGLPDATETHSHMKLPPILNLGDEVRLEKVKFLNDHENEDLQLPALVQNIVLGKLYFLYVSQPKEQLTLEEIQPYITTLVYQRCGPWATRVATLFMNASIEATHKRTVDRSLRQIEELIQQFEPSYSETAIPIADRLPLVFSSWPISYWQMKEKLADVMVSLGMMKGALAIYQEVQSWENVIECHTILEMRHLAAMVIKELMERNGPTVRLYCMLGDATDDVECYRQAWELSNETSASAQRHWGNYYFVRKDYSSAIEHLRRSIEINCLQEPTLLRLGYAALQLERWEEAAYAYRLYTSFENHGFEPWNNLAKAYIMLGEKPRAHKVLQEALKCNFSNWKVWENYLLVCVDTRNFSDALNAYERLLDLKDRYYDKEVLELIVRAILLGTPDADGTPCSRLKAKALNLLAHACAQQPNNGYLYELAAELEDVDLLKRCHKLQNAYRAYTQSNSQWSKGPESCATVVNLCVDLCERSLRAFVEGKSDGTRLVPLRAQLGSARLTGQACLRSANSAEWPVCAEPLQTLQDLVDKLTTELKQAMDS
ncbi:tetratricopeptide repeat protein 27 [Anopheles marshallii]|uniref:tetratricopeptide repeat protein 27 n=1 Tax=Anopheles marshallii TaxID=1521116 RepID=UPI00237B5D7D|nr:tetratricopeptide repeat protein 27 [Anopheles marshallii]